MSKPEDIPQDVWDVARQAFAELLTPFRYEAPEAFADAEYIARTIMAAKAEERQDCEDVALKHAAAYDDSANGLPVDSYKVPYRLHRRNAANDIAAAIRKRES